MLSVRPTTPCSLHGEEIRQPEWTQAELARIGMPWNGGLPITRPATMPILAKENHTGAPAAQVD